MRRLVKLLATFVERAVLSILFQSVFRMAAASYTVEKDTFLINLIFFPERWLIFSHFVVYIANYQERCGSHTHMVPGETKAHSYL